MSSHRRCWRVSQARKQHEVGSKRSMRHVYPKRLLTFNGINGFISWKMELVVYNFCCQISEWNALIQIRFMYINRSSILTLLSKYPNLRWIYNTISPFFLLFSVKAFLHWKPDIPSGAKITTHWSVLVGQCIDACRFRLWQLFPTVVTMDLPDGAR
jgi:hypothetical protein